MQSRTGFSCYSVAETSTQPKYNENASFLNGTSFDLKGFQSLLACVDVSAALRHDKPNPSSIFYLKNTAISSTSRMRTSMSSRKVVASERPT